MAFGSEVLRMDGKARKTALRRQIIQRIRAMEADPRKAQEAALVDRLADLPGFDQARTVLLYASAFVEEMDTGPLLRRSIEAGKRLILPRVFEAERRLHLFEIPNPDQDLSPSPRGIPEPGPDAFEILPQEVDWVLVPGLGFDTRGHRLGRGAGHYDRLLPQLRPDCPRWALILDTQWVDDLPIEPHDQPLDGIADHRRIITTSVR